MILPASDKTQNNNIDMYFWHLAAIAAVIAMAAAYRFTGLDRESLWADELWGVMACSKGSWMAMVRDLVFRDNHPPGYQTILYFVMLWFGKGDFTIRAVSAIAGILAVIATYVAGKDLFTRRAAIVAALIVAGSYQAIYYSQEARAYSLLMLGGMVSTHYFIKLFVRVKISNKNILIFALSSTFCAYLHYAGLVFILCEALLFWLIFLWSKKKQDIFSAAFYGFGIPLILYFKWIPVVYHHMTGIKNYWAAKPHIDTLYETYQWVLGPGTWPACFQILAVLASILIITKSLKKKTTSLETVAIAALIFMSVAPVMVFFTKSLVTQSVYTHRHFIFIIPLAAIITGHILDKGFVLIEHPLARTVAFCSVIIFIAIGQFYSNRILYTKIEKQDFRGAAEWVAEDKNFVLSFSENKSVIVASHDFFYHYLWAHKINAPASHSLSRYGDQEKYLESIIRNTPETVYFLEVSSTSSKNIRDILEAVYKNHTEKNLTGINVIKYSLPIRKQPAFHEKLISL